MLNILNFNFLSIIDNSYSFKIYFEQQSFKKLLILEFNSEIYREAIAEGILVRISFNSRCLGSRLTTKLHHIDID